MERPKTVSSTVEEPASSSWVNDGRTPGNESPENPFATPIAVTPVAASLNPRRATFAQTPSVYEGPRRRFKSSRLTGEFEKPWLEKSKKEINWDSIIFYSCIGIGLGIGAYLCWNATRGVPNHEYCLIMDDHFENLDNWNHEVQMNGFGTGSFDWTTDDSTNSYIDAEGLHIVPTMTLETTDITYEQLVNGYTVNMTTDSDTWGKCTSEEDETDNRKSTERQPCAARSNATLGQIINPVRSARLNTRSKKTIKYGRVEVRARMPKGDWMWPAIWMMPQDSVYGEWPKSGEIDIAEARGNDARDYDMGDNLLSSALHWGTASVNDRWRMSYGEWGGSRVRYGEAFHTYGLEWSEKYLFAWLDGRLRHVMFFDFTKNKNLWSYGEFAGESVNGSVPVDPWSSTGRANTPFDESFYLILNVAVGSTNGWFPDAVGGKPWADSSETPMRDFWKANSTWLPSWGPPEERGMVIQSVKMWQEGKC
ncbi:concanavalin A-like lectin/glucanase domain-containing protein [Dactylonectria estremocensis]|uniref:Concanavalin A-like lectin/glucanase domain-containing protein n=1 Tax=Dactylonectria estremocensis TaxID=1079267 RepID=A0A9P9J3K6_9HYPO|nr:concanavalin A-like lectin/glucanase domain-containing protein [Dactylonectria estremocensis]